MLTATIRAKRPVEFQNLYCNQGAHTIIPKVDWNQKGDCAWKVEFIQVTTESDVQFVKAILGILNQMVYGVLIILNADLPATKLGSENLQTGLKVMKKL